MDIITKDWFWMHYLEKVSSGAVFIYPTDTVYGIGCDATNEKAVERVRKIKGTDHPFSVIAPSKKWIKDNCAIREKKWLEKLPGPYTLVLKLSRRCVSKNVSGGKTIGVRIPDFWTKDIARRLDTPIVTTSANVSGSFPIKGIDELPCKLKQCDFFIDDGGISGRASTIIDLSGRKVLIKIR